MHRWPSNHMLAVNTHSCLQHKAPKLEIKKDPKGVVTVRTPCLAECAAAGCAAAALRCMCMAYGLCC